MTAKRRRSTARAKPAIPKARRLLESARRLAKGLKADLSGQSTYKRKTRSSETEVWQRNPWPRCQTCHRRHPTNAFACDKPPHRAMCVTCCGWPHEEDDEER